MQYSPKLKKAMEEIKAIIEREDIAAAVVLHTPGFREFYNKLDPSYSCAFFEYKGDGVMLRMRAKKEEYLTPEDHQKVIADTGNMLDHLSIGCGEMALNFLAALDMLDDKSPMYPIDGESGGTSHIQQNN